MSSSGGDIRVWWSYIIPRLFNVIWYASNTNFKQGNRFQSTAACIRIMGLLLSLFAVVAVMTRFNRSSATIELISWVVHPYYTVFYRCVHYLFGVLFSCGVIYAYKSHDI